MGMNQFIEAKFAKLVAIGLFMVTVLVIAGPVTDPVNVPKQVALVSLALTSSMYLFIIRKSIFTDGIPLPIKLVIVFILISIFVVLKSNAPFSQNLYGVNGRSTGLITYLAFALIFGVISLFTQKSSVQYLLNALIWAGALNIIYGFYNQFFGDPIPWTNIYGAFLGTFGNPNFSGAFLGLISGGSVAYMLNYYKEPKKFAFSTLLFLTGIPCVVFTKTTQGILVSAISIFIVLFLFQYHKYKNKMFNVMAIFVGIFGSFLIISGMLQKGPLSQVLYKRSVSLRGAYWEAAYNTGKANLWSGVGFDSFGDWYRRTRTIKAATWMPGPETITNAAHNYYLDIFASGGLFLTLSYLSFTALGIYSCIRIVKISKDFDYIGTFLIASFAAFQAQSIISIAQIGIAVWGWVIIAMLYSYSKIISGEINNTKELKISKDFPVGVFMFIGFSIGLILAIPPYSADAKWTNAVNSHELDRVQNALQPSYFSPQNSDRLANAALLLQRSNLPTQAYKIALHGVRFNPDNFSAWKVLYFLPASSDIDRKNALINMRRLDPKNKNLVNLNK